MQQPAIIKEKHNLKRLNSWRVGGLAQYFAEPTTVEELKDLCIWSKLSQVDIFLLADGTNLLVSDNLIQGLVISLKKMRTNIERVKFLEETKLKKDFSFSLLSGTPKNALFSICLKHNLPASIFLAGLPGSVGGGVVMNAGVGFTTSPKEFKDIVSWVEVLFFNKKSGKFKVKKYLNTDLNWSYRSCKNWKADADQVSIILEVGFYFSEQELNKALQNTKTILAEVKKAQVFRKTKQPINTFNCGSVFKNPTGHSAGALIDQCGLKSLSVGGASVSDLHANFIVAEQGTKAQDIFNLIKKIQSSVLEKKNISLSLEVKIMGSFGK